MGYNINMLSLQAILGLSGVIINDMIVLVESVKIRIAAGVAMTEAIVAGAASRLRLGRSTAVPGGATPGLERPWIRTTTGLLYTARPPQPPAGALKPRADDARFNAPVRN